MAAADIRDRIRTSLRMHYGDEATGLEDELWKSGSDDYVHRFVAAMCAPHDPLVRAEVSADVDAAAHITKKARDAAMVLPEIKSAAAVVYNSSTRCRVCKSSNVMERSVQTRSADEAATIKYVCQSCDAEWSR